MKAIELQIFYLNETQGALADAGINIQDDYESFDLRPQTFYQVDLIAPVNHDGVKGRYSKVFSGGEFFICNLSYQELKRKIEEA